MKDKESAKVKEFKKVVKLEKPMKIKHDESF